MDKKIESIGELKVGSNVIFDNKACVIKTIQKSSTGRHGHAKYRVSAVSLIDDQKIIKLLIDGEKVEVPIINKKSAQVLSIQENIVNVMDNETYETFDLKIPEELKDQVKEGAQVSYWIILGEKILKQIK